ncbi:cobalt ECF transporter T component CbiQ [Xanthobacter pseudotagetidis]|uniref:cobalt ECF transporter T component CbiQ n=1 Tax=Xanthobacter pseudotagetidis TaxID=3119911 RepID=UPI00372AD2ED
MPAALGAAVAPLRLGVEALDPRTRLLGAFVAVVAVALLSSLPVLAVAALGALALALAAGPGAAALMRRLVHLEGFMLVLLAFLPFTVPGTPLFGAPPLAASAEGFARALQILLKVNACGFLVFALLGGLEPVRIGAAALALKAPERLVQLFLLVVRYGGVLRAETARLQEAMRARAFAPRSSLHTWRTYGHMLGMVLVRALERAERVSEAMRCRGFAGRLPAPAERPAFGPADLAFALLLAAAILAALAAERLP